MGVKPLDVMERQGQQGRDQFAATSGSGRSRTQETSPMELRPAAGGATSDGGESSDPIRLQESVTLVSARLDAVRGRTSNGRESSTNMATA